MNGSVSARLRPSVYNGWKISLVRDRTPQLIGALFRIWEESVKATHLFLNDEEIAAIARYVPQALQNVQDLAVAEDENDAVAAFLGVEGKKIEMLFVTPERRGRGIGRALIEFLVRKYKGRNSVLQVGTGDSPLTIPFYEKCGFVRSHRIANFFTDNYDCPIYECGVKLIDMVYLQRHL